MMQIEHDFDLTGSLTYVTVAESALVLRSAADARVLLLATLVVVCVRQRHSSLSHPSGEPVGWRHTGRAAVLAAIRVLGDDTTRDV